ncbi:MAG: ABC transporter ATP-binding protein, partial [Chloroflexi bacterium]|nr:ABC transporter ATP-binding protein [Chloroflexota bacterium]
MSFLRLHGIQKHFPGGLVAVKGFDLEAERGEFVSLLGPSGCGKTTTLRMIAGFEQPTAGTITIDGADITGIPPNRRNIGMVFQSYALFPNMSVADNVAFGLKMRKRDNPGIKRRVAELLDLIHLPDKADRFPFELSGGQQQRVALARALAFEPTVLLLDEPLSALDAKIRVALRHEIREIQRQLGITTVYVTHDQEEALELSDRIVVMSEGRVEQTGSPFEIYNFPATAFVASFVGTLNVLAATILDPGQGRLKLGDHEVRTRSTLDGPAGSAVSIALRPEMISLTRREGSTIVPLGASGSEAGSSADSNELPATIVDVAFLGSVVRVRTTVGRNETPVFVDTFNNPNLAVPPAGSLVSLMFPPEACLILGRHAVPDQ